MLIPDFRSEATEVISCPDGLLYKTPDNEYHPGQWLRCEDFDNYYALMQAGEYEQARLTYLAPNYDKSRYRGLNPVLAPSSF